MSKEILEYFGKILMTEVRDRTIDQWEGNIEGRMKSKHSQEIFQKLQQLNIEEREYLKQLFSEVVDTTLHYLLTMIEENEKIEMNISNDSRKSINIKQISDGLAGELYTEDGWIHSFSNKRK